MNELAKDLQTLHDKMLQNEGADWQSWETMYGEALRIAQKITEHAVEKQDGRYTEYRGLRDYLKQTPLRISEKDSIS